MTQINMDTEQISHERRRKDSSKLIWDTKPKRAPNPKDIEFQTAEVVIPNPNRDQQQLSSFFADISRVEIDRTKMNRLIWGDNLLAMQALLASGYEGKINLIYIDPPFSSNENYYLNVVVEGEEVTKSPSVIERLAYKDYWEGGLDSYLDMLYPRLHLMRRLLARNGSIYVHTDWHVGHYVKVLMDEVFGSEHFRNEVAWCYSRPSASVDQYPRVHENILFYTKSDDYTFNRDDIRIPYSEETVARSFRGIGEKSVMGTKAGYERIHEKGKVPEDWWTIRPLQGNQSERTGFPTQKPEALLERIILASSNPNDIVADFFMGSGTAVSAAEQKDRRWIGCDFSKTSIQIARNRLVSLSSRPFLIENIGNYQRHMIYLSGGRIFEMQHIVLKLYGAMPRKDYPELGTKKADDGVNELVYVGYPDRAVTAKKTEELAHLAETLDGTGYRRLVVLGWDFEYNYEEILGTLLRPILRRMKVEICNRTIPPEVYEYLKTHSSEDDIDSLAGKVKFHDKPFLKLARPKIQRSKGQATVGVGIERYIVYDLPLEDEKQKEELQEVVKKNFAALLDYWAVDWDYDGFTFKSSWQAFRGFIREIKEVPLGTIHTLPTGKRYTIAVRAIDIFGNDATATCTADLR
jgi:adenine-specific DNA-methyltransferase